ncbi:MAG TPA: CHASE3 domain-containing protein [Pirellulales bacterium]
MLTRAVVFPLALAFFVGGVFTWQVTNLLSVNAAVERSDQVIDDANRLQMLAVDMETGLRGYVITQKEAFLQPFNRAVQPFSDCLKDLRGLVANRTDRRATVDQIAEQVAKWREYAEAVKAQIERGENDAAASQIVTGEGKQIMDGMRDEVGQLIAGESALRKGQSQAARSAATAVLATCVGLCVAFGILAAYLARRQLFSCAKTYNQALLLAAQRDLEKSQLLAAERTLRSASEHANRMKDDFLSTLSHELRTPLNAILGWSQLLRQSGRSTAELDEGLETIERNARLQTRLIEDLLDMSRIISGKVRMEIQSVQPATFIEAAIGTIRPAAEAKGVRIEQQLDQTSGPISGDPARLQQVVWNLLSNAVKFTAKGGLVRISMQRIDSHLEIAVADTGLGIQPEFLPYVFERFRQADASTTRKHGGLGLGLAIVKQLVELHGGGVRALSAGVNQGATFIIHLPLVAVHPILQLGDGSSLDSTESPPAALQKLTLSGLKVLVVDDHADARDLIAHVLNASEATVVIAETAVQALALLESELPNVIVSDIGMPDVDGYALLQKIRALGPTLGGLTPVVALTAFARAEDKAKALDAGFAAHLTKPVEPTVLVSAIVGVVRPTT